MNPTVLILGGAGLLLGVGVLIWAIKYAGRRGEERGDLGRQAEQLAEDAKREARMDEVMAEPLDESARSAWDRLVARRQRMRNDLGSGEAS